MVRLDTAGHLLLVRRAKDLHQPDIQLGQSFCRMGNTDRAELSSGFVKRQRIMLLICPVYTDIQQSMSRFLPNNAPEWLCPSIVVADRTTFS